MPARRRSLDGLHESPMSPATARIHRRNINNPPQTAAAVGGAETGRGPFKQHSVITTPSFTALPLFLPLTDEQVASYASTAAPPAKRHKGQTATPSSSHSPPSALPSPPPSSLISSRGRHIKLREGSVHLHRREHSSNSQTSPPTATTSLSPSPSPSPSSPPPLPSSIFPPAQQPTNHSSQSSPSVPCTAIGGEALSAVAGTASFSAFSSAVYRSWVHSWCLWQMRCEYLLGEVRRRLSKREAGRAMQSPHSNRKRAQDKQSDQPTSLGERSKRDSEGRTEKEEVEMKESDEQKATEEAAAPSIASPDYFSSLVGRIPPLHTQLTLPILDSLSFVSSVPVPPSPLHLPLLSALAACLMLPLPCPLSAVAPSAAQRPFHANYQLKDGQAWSLPQQRIALQWAEAPECDEDDEARTGSTKRGSSIARQLPQRVDKPSKPEVERKQQQRRAADTQTKKSGDKTHTNARPKASHSSPHFIAMGSVGQAVKEQVTGRTAVRVEGGWFGELSPTQIREANRLSRQQRMEERARREKMQEARQLIIERSKRRRTELITPTNPNDIAAQAAEDLLATLTDTPS